MAAWALPAISLGMGAYNAFFNKPKAPPPVDPNRAIESQGSENRKAARLTGKYNQLDSYGPFGGSYHRNWNKDGGGYTVEHNASPHANKLMKSGIGALMGAARAVTPTGGSMGGVSGGDARGFTGGPLGGISLGGSIGDSYNAVRDALMERIDEAAVKDRAAHEGSLAARGLQKSSIGDDERYLSDRAVNDRRVSALLGAGQEHSRLLAEARAQEQLRRGGIRLGHGIGMANVGVAQSLAGSVPTSAPGIQVGGVNAAGAHAAANQSNLQRYQSKTNTWNELTGGLIGLGWQGRKDIPWLA